LTSEKGEDPGTEVKYSPTFPDSVSENRLTLASVLLVLSAVLMWSISFPLIKVGLDYVPPVTFSAMRYLIAALLIVVILVRRTGWGGMIREYLGDWKMLTLVALFGVALPNALLNIGMQYTTASLSSIIQASSPMWTVVLAVMLLSEPLGIDKTVGTIIAMAGTVLLVTENGIDLNNTSFLGNLLVMGTALSYAVSGVVTKVALRKHHPVETTGWSLIVGSLILLAFTPLEWGSGVSLTQDFLIILFVLAIFPGVLAILFYNYVLRETEVSSLAFFIYLIPVFATIISILFLGETITWRTAILAFVVILGVATAQYRLITRWRRKRDEDR